MEGELMSEIRWDLSGTDKRCEKYGPGHWVHWIHHRKSLEEPSIGIPVQVIADDGGLFTLQGPDLLLERWNHRPALVRNALQRSRGSAIWIPRWRLLVVGAGDRVNGASNVFHLGPLEAVTACAGVRNVASRSSSPHTSRSDSPHETSEEDQ
jgi:hypothetical protein